jgi:peptide/nickel transport system substrate-binding protein
MSREEKANQHAFIPELKNQLVKGEIGRREFLRTTTLLGMSAGAVYTFANMITGPGLISPAEAAGKKGGKIRFAMVVQDMADPAKYDWSEKANIARHTLDYLTITGADGVTRPMLAESWSASDDLKTWTLNIRKGVKFGNGDELTADDIVFNIKRWLDPATGSSIQGLLNSMVTTTDTGEKDDKGKAIIDKQMTEGAVEKVDKYTVRMHLNSAELSIPEKMYHYPAAIVHRSFDEKGSDSVANPDLGTGPYAIAEYVLGEKAILKRRGGGFKYWGDEPFLDEIHYYDTGTESSAALAALASDQVDGIYTLDLTLIEAVKAMPGMQVNQASTAQTGVIRMQVDAKPFDDIRVRRAMLLASDNDQNLQTAHQGFGQVGENHHVCACQPDYAKIPTVKRDVAKAKALLAEAGHGGGLEITCNVGNTNGTWEQDSVAVLKQNLAEVGINVNINVMPSAQYWEVWNKADFSLTSWTHRPLATMLLGLAYRAGVPWNETNYNSPTFDSLLDEAEATLDINERIKVMAKVEKTIQDDAIMVQPFFRSVMNATRSTFKGMQMHPTNYHQWNKVWVES